MTRNALKSRLMAALAAACACIACGDNSVEPEADPEPFVDPCTSAAPITLGQSVTGSLGSGDCPRSGVWTDRWSLDLASATAVRIDLSSNDFDAYLELRTASGAVVAENDDAGSLDSRIIEDLSAGSYVIVARSLGEGQVGSYRLSVVVGPDCSAVGSISVGQSVSGTLDASDCLFEWGGLMDNWTLSLNQPSALRLEVSSADFDEALIIRDSRGDIFYIADGFGPTGRAIADLDLAAGEWTVSAVSIFETPGSYELSVDVRPACTPGTALVLDQTFNGTIDVDDCIFQGWTPADSLSLVLDEGAAVDIVMKSTDFYPFFVVFDATGAEVLVGFQGFDPNTGAPTGVARAGGVLPAGSYAVYAVTEGYPSATGAYQLTVSELVCDDPTPIAFGSSASGTLEAGDCLGNRGAWVDNYELVLPADTTVRIDLTSPVFDTYLVLRDSEGTVLQADDDGGTGLNSRIERSLGAGTYVIEASALVPGVGGAYTLTVGDPSASGVAPSAVGVRSGLVKRWELTRSLSQYLTELRERTLAPWRASARKGPGAY